MPVTYTMRRRFTASAVEEIHEALADLYHTQAHRELYVSLRCGAWCVGRPMRPVKRRKRWFETSENPDQLWLPFEDYEPARVTLVEPVSLGRGWLIECRREIGYRARYHLDRPNLGPDAIMVIETYEKVRVRSEEPINPFPNCQNAWNPCRDFSDHSVVQWTNSPTRRGCFVVPNQLPTELAAALAPSYVKPKIECSVADALGLDRLNLDIETGLLYNECEEVEAQVIDVQTRSLGEYIFRVRLDEDTREDWMVLVRDPACRASMFANLYSVPNEVLAS